MAIVDKYKFTVIMPIYNTEKYLVEAIESVINQSIGLSNIQLILVDNASTDGSGDICARYAKNHPDNVIHLRLENNVGPSGARNAGIPLIEGRYVNFFDSDDIWPRNAFADVWQFFEKNKKRIDVVSCRMKFFEAREGYYPELDKKFQESEDVPPEDRVCSVEKEYTALQLHVTSAFIKRRHATENRFDESMNHLEDSKFINTIILRKLSYGVLGNVEYNYRSRFDQNSLLNTVRKTEATYFTHTLDQYLQYFIDLSKGMYGVVIPYIQYMIAYTVGNRLKERMTFGILDDAGYDEYKNRILSLLEQVDDSILMSSTTIWGEYKMHAMELKHPDLYQSIYCPKRIVKYNNVQVFNFDRKDILNIFVLEIRDNSLYLYGQLDFPFPEDEYDFFFKDNLNRRHDCIFDQYDRVVESLGEPFFTKRGFSIRIPIDNGLKKITAYVNYRGEDRKLFFRFGFYGKLNGGYNSSYYINNGFVVSPAHMSILIKKAGRRKNYEKKYLQELRAEKQYDVVKLRLAALAVRRKYKKSGKQIWLFLDRIASADDNAEFLCDYVEAQNNKNLDIYYVLTKDSPDLERVKKKHKVLIYGSFKYNVMCLAADVAITSEQRLVRPEEEEEFIRDLWPKGVFLQHGLVEKDISDNWNRLHWNDRLFIASAQEEYDYFLKYKYGFTDREVKLTGMPRTDKITDLINQPEEERRIICFAPTWRENLAMPLNPETRMRPCNENFMDSDYFKFYNSLINDARILEAMRSNGYIGVLQLHPCFWEDAKFFDANDLVSIETTKKPYYDQYKDTAMVITDYSSIAFEYSYINRMVVYSQFDVDEFYDNHTYDRGFYDYEKEGFGPVCFNYEDTVEAIVNSINNKCKMGEEYKARRDNFFAYFDGNNCERIYKEILKITSEDKK